MDQRISSIALGVADLARSRRFYEDGLGWKCGGTETEIALYQVGGMVLALFSRAALAADANLESEGTGFGSITLAYNVGTRGEVDAVLAEAKAAGATILKSAEGRFLGRLCGLFRRSRRPSLGGRVEPPLDPRGRRKHAVATQHVSGRVRAVRPTPCGASSPPRPCPWARLGRGGTSGPGCTGRHDGPARPPACTIWRPCRNPARPHRPCRT